MLLHATVQVKHKSVLGGQLSDLLSLSWQWHGKAQSTERSVTSYVKQKNLYLGKDACLGAKTQRCSIPCVSVFVGLFGEWLTRTLAREMAR